ncbi:hypothetical protein [Nonomuraea gerenzanensis]|uniref:Uncharacterized protein n=1 Tax=Nonomuraea gerenzanensis TaxID=93944 RepID=A0A1M4BKU6_9ACTN|nr:hypothetical protein [Nonomuraea gerenzanensis]UBU10034.1 hypothetical protein LCN96_37535 [Nonomuraea gerenzanensis]SAP16257.1 hypothetical protein BN4615_P10920 [Nonomuraea gerenzanensis]
MARFRNISGEDRHVGRVDGPVVAAGEVVPVDEDVTGQSDDAYIVGSGDEARAWPKSTWELLEEPKSRKASE